MIKLYNVFPCFWRSGQGSSALQDVRSRLMTPGLPSHEVMDNVSETRSMASLMSYTLGNVFILCKLKDHTFSFIEPVGWNNLFFWSYFLIIYNYRRVWIWYYIFVVICSLGISVNWLKMVFLRKRPKLNGFTDGQEVHTM